MFVSFGHRTVSPVAKERRALCLSSGNIEMFPVLPVQSHAYYQEVMPLIISHLESPTETTLTNTLSFSVIRNVCVSWEGFWWVLTKFTKFTYSARTTINDWTTVRCHLILTVAVNFIVLFECTLFSFDILVFQKRK